MREILGSIKAYLYDRSSSPLFGAFVISWSLWNYKVIATLLASDALPTKFAEIDRILGSIDFAIGSSNYWVSAKLFDGFIMPALATVFYIYAYPYLAKPVYEYSLRRQKELREIKQEQENNQLLSVEDSRELYKKLALLQETFDKETAGYQRELSELRKVIAGYEKNEQSGHAESGTSNRPRKEKKVSNGEEAVLKQFVGLADDEPLSDLEIHRNVGGPIDVVRVHLEDLASKDYLRYSGSSPGRGTLYLLQSKGRRYLVEHMGLADATAN